MRVVLIVLGLTLAGCGADGDPKPVASGVKVSGEARIGVSGSI